MPVDGRTEGHDAIVVLRVALRFGERLRATATAELELIAKEIEPGAHWQEIAAQLRTDIPTPDSALDEYRQAMEASRNFTIAHDLMPVPNTTLEVVPTPDFLRPLIPLAAYQGPGAFDAVQRGLFLVTLPENGESWRSHCRAELPTICSGSDATSSAPRRRCG